jgi:succinate dehydrogenase hydrophobic anchor subunit
MNTAITIIAVQMTLAILGILLFNNANKCTPRSELKERFVLRSPLWVYILYSLVGGLAVFFIITGMGEILDKNQTPKMPRAIAFIVVGLAFLVLYLYAVYTSWNSKLLVTRYGIAEIYPKTLRMEDITKTRWFHKVRFSKISGYHISNYYLVVDDGKIPKKIFSLIYKDIHKLIGVLKQKNL